MEPSVVNILLIEDNQLDSRLLRALLPESEHIHYELTEVPRLGSGLEHLKAGQHDVVLVDLSLPDSHGIDTFTQLHAAAPNIPVLVLSGLDDERLAVRAVREGAQDYLVKGKFDGHTLSRAITYAIERHRIELELQEKERLQRHLLESITDYRFSVEVEAGEARRAVHGPGCVAVTGYTQQEYEQDADLLVRMIHAEDRERVLDETNRVFGGQTPTPVEHRILHRNGEVRWVRLTIVPRQDRNGGLIGYDGLISDITERKEAEEKLVTSEAFYHSLVENLPQFILRKDLSERFTFANQLFCHMLGKPLEEIIGKTDFDFFPPELATKYQQDDRHVIETGETFETVEANQNQSGEKIYVNVVKTPIYNAVGQIIGIQGIFWDITDRKRFEEQLQNANEELAQSERALRRSNEELKAAQAQLIQAEKMESVGTLAAGVAHEVKNPLAILLMGVNFLSKKFIGKEENVDLVLKEMKDAITRADTITRGLLDFSASRELSFTTQEINQLVRDTLAMVRHELNKSQIQVSRNLGEDLPSIRVDRTQIQQVLVNLFVNAIHAMPEGGSLTIRTYLKRMTETVHFEGTRRADHFWVGATVVVVEVEDTGKGIPDQFLSKIYDPFFTTKPTGLGTGLGLPVSLKIIELHGGVLEIKNRPEGGVRATVMLKPHGTQHSSDHGKKAHSTR